MKLPIIVDAHLDLAYNMLKYERDYLHSAHATRAREGAGWQATENGQCTVGFPDMMRGRVGLAFATIFVEPARGADMGSSRGMAYTNAREAHAQGVRQLDAYLRLVETDARLKLVRYQQDFRSVLDGWTEGVVMGPHPEHRAARVARRKLGLVLLMEGADPILEPKQVEWWYEKGVRIIGLAWSQTRYSGGTGAPGGLTALGRELLGEMARYGIVLDVSHMAHQALMEALERFEGQHIIASHSNPHRITPTDRHLPDEAIHLIAARKGVIGVVLYNRFLKHDWPRASAGGLKRDVTLDHVLRHIDTICQLTGSAAHVGLGSDFDGGFGSESIPREIDTIRDLHRVADALVAHGYSEADVIAIMGGNWLRVLQQALPS